LPLLQHTQSAICQPWLSKTDHAFWMCLGVSCSMNAFQHLSRKLSLTPSTKHDPCAKSTACGLLAVWIRCTSSRAWLNSNLPCCSVHVQSAQQQGLMAAASSRELAHLLGTLYCIHADPLSSEQHHNTRVSCHYGYFLCVLHPAHAVMHHECSSGRRMVMQLSLPCLNHLHSGT
jgi:hypothetical protein